jgi:hypothetical protein
MADQLVPYFNEDTGERIGWARIIDGHVIVTDITDTAILAGTTPDGEVVDGSYFHWSDGSEPEYDEPNEYAEELLARVNEIEQQMVALDEPEPEWDYDEYDEQAELDELWTEKFREELGDYERHMGRQATDREVHGLTSEHYAQWQRDPESVNIWAASTDVPTPDLDTHQGRVDRGGELLEDADRASRGVAYDPRGERAATEYPDTNLGRTNLALDMMNGFVDKDGQPTGAVPAGVDE